MLSAERAAVGRRSYASSEYARSSGRPVAARRSTALRRSARGRCWSTAFERVSTATEAPNDASSGVVTLPSVPSSIRRGREGRSMDFKDPPPPRLFLRHGQSRTIGRGLGGGVGGEHERV